MVALGAKWRVGDGESIKVFEDCWLPGSGGGKLNYAHSGVDRNLRVAELMTPEKNSWNGQLIDSIFLPHGGKSRLYLCV